MKIEPSWRVTLIIVAVMVFILGLVYLGRGDFALEAWRDIWGALR